MAALPWPLLALLADGEYHSGETLGNALGVGRAAVWKMIQTLQSQGFEVESVRGQGYCIVGGVDLLSADDIKQALIPAASDAVKQLDVLTQIDSTNTEIARAHYTHGAVLLAERQTAGRGRRGRAWVSPVAANLYLSIRWGFSGGIASLEGLSLAVGVVLAEALSDLGVSGVELKWPNDLWVQGKKLGGILIEIGGDVNGDCHAIVGVGLNVKMPSKLTEKIDQAWVDLAALGYRSGRNQLAASVVNKLVGLLSDYQQVGFGGYRAQWLERNALAGRPVSVSGSQSLQGVVSGVTVSGGLLLVNDAGEHVVNGGEVSVRPHDC